VESLPEPDSVTQAPQAAQAAQAAPEPDRFAVSLDVYQGPFDVLLSMIAQRRLYVTELALADITSEFIQYVSAMDVSNHADEASEFLVVASILVEAKSAALLPGGADTPDAEQSLEALRERDLLFARLLQYKAFKQAGESLRTLLAGNSGRYEHHPELTQAQRTALADVTIDISPYDFALLAARAFANAPAQEVSLKQLHVPIADLQRESALIKDRLSASHGTALTFDELIADAQTRGEVVARFLGVLAFFKLGFIQFKQEEAFAPLSLRWVATDEEYQQRGVTISEEDFQ